MGIRVSRRVHQGEQQYRLWSTISDSWLTDWSSRQEALQFLAEDALSTYKQHVIKLYYTFPLHFVNHDRKKEAYIVQDNGSMERYTKWVTRSLEAENYEAFIDAEFERIMAELEGEVST